MGSSNIRGVSLDMAETHSAIIFWRDDTFVGTDTFEADNRSDMIGGLIGFLSVRHSRSPIKWISTERAVLIKNAKRYGELSKMLGVVEYWCLQHNVAYFEGTTTQIDSANDIPHCQRKERKGHTRAIAERFFPEAGKLNEDECDAVVTGIWGWGKYKELLWSREEVT